ncbi:MAG TPA: FMN-binding negative transcriptional regulator [Candidatus Competibacteraceae bacterium]|nr:FMN-binding negative transcriptional regulator [Candidatus Competibacteraceae bacterium]
MLSTAYLGVRLPSNNMYCPSHFQEDRLATLVSLIEQFPLATIIRNTADGLTADHVPLLYAAVPGCFGKLAGHVAKNNPLWQIPPDQELLVVFQGPSTYISPNWYATKHNAGKVVPTWNYAVVHAYCSLQAIREPEQIQQIITGLTDQHESSQAHPWRVADAPSDFTGKLLGNIVGIHLHINRLQGKWKVSQNQPKQNQQSIAHGLLSEGSDAQTQMALLVQSHGAK